MQDVRVRCHQKKAFIDLADQTQNPRCD